jgi:hypothetical protein
MDDAHPPASRLLERFGKRSHVRGRRRPLWPSSFLVEPRRTQKGSDNSGDRYASQGEASDSGAQPVSQVREGANYRAEKWPDHERLHCDQRDSRSIQDHRGNVLALDHCKRNCHGHESGPRTNTCRSQRAGTQIQAQQDPGGDRDEAANEQLLAISERPSRDLKPADDCENRPAKYSGEGDPEPGRAGVHRREYVAASGAVSVADPTSDTSAGACIARRWIGSP